MNRTTSAILILIGWAVPVTIILAIINPALPLVALALVIWNERRHRRRIAAEKAERIRVYGFDPHTELV